MNNVQTMTRRKFVSLFAAIALAFSMMGIAPSASFAAESDAGISEDRLLGLGSMAQTLAYHDVASNVDASFDEEDGTFCIEASESTNEIELTKSFVRTLIKGVFNTGNYSGAEKIQHLIIKGETIKAIQGSAFSTNATTDYSNIKSVDLSRSAVSSIQGGAFNKGASIESVELPSDLDVTIDSTAFSGCTKLTLMSKPLNGELIFDRQPADSIECVACGSREYGIKGFCEHGLISILDAGATVSVNGAIGVKVLHVPVRSAIEKLDGVDAGSVRKVVLEEGITDLSLERDFSGLVGLEEVVLPASLVTVPTQSFEGCVSLKELDLSNTQIESLENSANMLYGTSVKTVSLPKTLKIIGSGAFGNLPTLKTVNFAEDGCLEEIQGGAFQQSGLEEIVIPDTVKSIGRLAFQACPNLKTVSVSKSIESIDDEAFSSSKDFLTEGQIVVRDSCGTPAALQGKSFADRVAPALEHSFDTYIVVEPEEPEADQGGIVLQHACSICGEADPDVAPVTLDDLLKQTADEAADATRAEYADYSSPEQVEAAKAAAAEAAKVEAAEAAKAEYADWSSPADVAAATEAAATQASKAASAQAAKAAKKLNTLKVKSKTIAAKTKKKTVVNASKAFGTTKAQGKVTYKVLAKDPKAKSKIAVAKKTGKVTVKKGLKKGTYKLIVQVNAAGNSKYYAGSKVVTLKVKVK